LHPVDDGNNGELLRKIFKDNKRKKLLPASQQSVSLVANRHPEERLLGQCRPWGAFIAAGIFSLLLFGLLRVCWVEYGEALLNTQDVCKTLQQFLGIPLNLPAMAAQVDPSLYRQRQASSLSVTKQE